MVGGHRFRKQRQPFGDGKFRKRERESERDR